MENDGYSRERKIGSSVRIDVPSILRISDTNLVVVPEFNPDKVSGRIIFFAATGKSSVSRESTSPEISLGTGRDNTFVIDDKLASKNHARIRRGMGGWYVEDLGSKSGTTLTEIPTLNPGETQQLPVGEWRRTPRTDGLSLHIGGTDISFDFLDNVPYVYQSYSPIMSISENRPVRIGNGNTDDVFVPVDKHVLQVIPLHDGVLLFSSIPDVRAEVDPVVDSSSPESISDANLRIMNRQLIDLISGESWGGNAGRVVDSFGNRVLAAGANFYINPENGRIKVFGNIQDLPKELFRVQGTMFNATFRVSSNHIFEITSVTEVYGMSPLGSESLDLSIKKWNDRGISANTPRPFF